MSPAPQGAGGIWMLRAALKGSIREFLGLRGSVEIDTPVLVVCPGVEVHLGYFCTSWVDHRGSAHPLFLRSSPELHMKQALSLGLTKIFQLAACFRNGGELSPWHHPEFTMLEWYEAGVGFHEFIDQTEELLRFTREQLASRFPGRVALRLPGRFVRMRVEDAFREFAGIALVDRDPELARKAKGIGSVSDGDDFETAYFKLLVDVVEPGIERLGGVVLHDYPPSQAVLSRVEGGWAKRFEFYLEGVELCNGFLELTDPGENRRRVLEALDRRRSEAGGVLPGQRPSEPGTRGETGSVPIPDEEFFRALDAGIPPCAGNALGFDRWLALLLGERGIARVIPFRKGGVFRNADVRLETT